MSGKSVMRVLAALGVAAGVSLGATGANAANFDLTLNGHSADLSEFQTDCCGFHFDIFSLSLSGLDAMSAITVNPGDTINARIFFDAPVNIPASVSRTSFILFLSGSQFPDADTSTVDGTTSFFLGGNQFLQGTTGGTSTHGEFAAQGDFFPPDNGPLTFDEVISSFTISTPNQPITLDGSSIEVALAGPGAAVPEPAAWALMLLGFAGAGAAVRARRSAVA